MISLIKIGLICFVFSGDSTDPCADFVKSRPNGCTCSAQTPSENYSGPQRFYPKHSSETKEEVRFYTVYKTEIQKQMDTKQQGYFQ